MEELLNKLISVFEQEIHLYQEILQRQALVVDQLKNAYNEEQLTSFLNFRQQRQQRVFQLEDSIHEEKELFNSIRETAPESMLQPLHKTFDDLKDILGKIKDADVQMQQIITEQMQQKKTKLHTIKSGKRALSAYQSNAQNNAKFTDHKK